VIFSYNIIKQLQHSKDNDLNKLTEGMLLLAYRGSNQSTAGAIWSVNWQGEEKG